MLNVLDEEGVRLADPKLKLMGIEAVKSSTPGVCRVKIKEAIKTIMGKEETDLHKLVSEFKKEFFELEPERAQMLLTVQPKTQLCDSHFFFESSSVFKLCLPLGMKA